MSMGHDWPVYKMPFIDLPIKMKENSERSTKAPEQGYRRCFVGVTNRGLIKSATQATCVYQIVTNITTASEF